MPNLSRCKYMNGRNLCWDADREEIVVVKIEPIALSKLSDDEIKAFIKDVDTKETKDGNEI